MAGTGNASMTPAQQQAALRQYDAAITAQIAYGSQEMIQQIFSQNYAAGNILGQVINVAPRYVGLLKKFVVEITGTFAQSGAETQTQTKLGIANLLSQVVFTDLSNNQRINTAGWHLDMLASFRPANNKQLFGAAYTTDSPRAYGNNFGVIKAPAAVTAAVPFRMFYEIPIAYSDDDYRGSIMAAVVNATMNLQLTINPNFSVGPAADPTTAVYQSSVAGQAGILSGLTVTVYQVYMDQLPQGPNGTQYPPLSTSTIYEIKNTTVSGFVAGSDYPIPYANQRNFMSTALIFDNGGVLNAGTDVNYLMLLAANMIPIFKMDPFMQTLQTRKILGDDPPPGCYYFDYRRKPLNTIMNGNLQLIINPSTVNSNAAVLVGWESFAYINTAISGASLAAS